MYEMNEEDKKTIETLDYEIIDKIIGHPKLKIESEDELTRNINKLYLTDRKYSQLYLYVYFMNVSVQQMNEFISIIDYGDISHETWCSILKRLSCDIIKKEQNDNGNEDYRYEKNKEEIIIKTFPYSNQAFNGIIQYGNVGMQAKFPN